MKKNYLFYLFSFLFALFLTTTAMPHAASIQQPDKFNHSAYIFDNAGIMHQSEIEKIQIVGSKIEEKTGIKIVVYISTELPNSFQGDYGQNLFRELNLDDKDQGILLLFNKSSDESKNQNNQKLLYSKVLSELFSSQDRIYKNLSSYFSNQRYSEGMLVWYTNVASLVVEKYNINNGFISSFKANC